MARSAFAALLGSAMLASSAAAAGYAPVHQPGPPLSVPSGQLAQSLSCTETVASGRSAVLLIPPTLFNPDEAFVGYDRALDAMGLPYCSVTIPDFTSEDVQVSAEFVVSALREIHAVTDRKVTILGWSQGGGPLPLAPLARRESSDCGTSATTPERPLPHARERDRDRVGAYLWRARTAWLAPGGHVI